MPWFKVDDSFATHPKVVRAGNAAIGLWVRAGTWAAAQLTDGHIPNDMIPVLGGKPADVHKLTSLGLWDRTDDGYQFHDWSDYQPTSADVKRARDAQARSGREGNHRRWHLKKGVTDPACEFCQPTQNGRAPDPLPDLVPDW